MPRQACIVIPELAHHITQRGNYHQNIFDNEGNNTLIEVFKTGEAKEKQLKGVCPLFVEKDREKWMKGRKI